jgi:hypothetical protein
MPDSNTRLSIEIDRISMDSSIFFLNDNELFELFVSDNNPPLVKSILFRINVLSGIVELQGIRGNILAVRRLKQATNTIQVKLDTPSTTEVEKRLQAAGFARSAVSSRAGFTDFVETVKPPTGYTQQCGLVSSIWRSWWPIRSKTLNGQAAVLVFHEGKWHEVKEVEVGATPTIAIPNKYIKVAPSLELTWAIDSRFAKGTKVEERVKHAHARYADERAWAQETVLSGSKSTLAQVLTEITTSSHKWIDNIKSIDADMSGLLDEASTIDRRKRRLIQAIESLVSIAKEE